MKEYTIAKREYKDGVWEDITPLHIDTFKWVPGYEPETTAKLFHDGKNLYIKFEAHEKEITARYTKMHEPVFKDSCVEFFVRPLKDDRYFNFETNVIGTLLLGQGAERDNRAEIHVDPAIFEMKPSVTNPDTYCDDKWTLEYKIPFTFFDEYSGKFDIKDGIFANVYKCGDESVHEHYGMWNLIELGDGEADFHCPEFFGRMYFEQ